MMENEQWTSKRQQSVGTTVERTGDSLNNGNSEIPMDGCDNIKNAGNNDSETVNGTEVLNQRNSPPTITISEKSKQVIHQILDQIKTLSPIEKYIFSLKYPSEISNVIDPFRQPLNPLGSRSEIYRTISWIKTHLEEDPDTSLPKQEVYDEYYRFCDENKFKPLSQADFGKAMKQVYPNVRARRLGTRGKSRYCYSGLRRCLKLKPPLLPDLADKPMSTEAPFTHSSYQSAWLVIKEWAKQQLKIEFSTLHSLALYLVLNLSICEGTDFAYKLSQTDSHIKEETNGKIDSKHREMQMQLQRKIQQKSELIKDRKRKIQVPIAKLSQHLGNAKKQLKNTKYKAIQPKIELCDIASYNRQPNNSADENRSQDVHDIDRFKEKKYSNDDCDGSDFPLPRERLNSISNVEKDAMDEYLGTNNSQHDEELSKYFNNNIQPDVNDDTRKLTHLRHMLQQNGIDNKNVTQDKIGIIEDDKFINPVLHQGPLQTNNPYVNAIPPPNVIGQARRRVSFEMRHDDPVPPSPNTRRKNFSFTPISPGPQSPNSLQSKCSSTNESPFVSPRNTPVPRSKNNTHQNAGIMLSSTTSIDRKPLKIKKELLPLELPDGRDLYNKDVCIPMSAPPSPMLQKLLNSKVPYKPHYTHSQSLNMQSDTSTEVTQLLTNQIANNLSDLSYRSQSVPVNQMYNQFITQFSKQNDFTEVDPIPEAESTNVKQIIDALEEPQCENNNIDLLCNMELTTSNQSLPEYGLQIVNNNLDMQEYPPSIPYNNHVPNPCPRNIGRSQSIDVLNFDTKCNNPSRSVPSTPLPYNPILKPELISSSSRSYPSTPLNNTTDNFNYNINGDCLLNGQPIRTDDLTHNLDFINYSQLNGDNNIEQEKAYEFIVDNDSSLMDGVLIEQNYNNTIN